MTVWGSLIEISCRQSKLHLHGSGLPDLFLKEGKGLMLVMAARVLMSSACSGSLTILPVSTCVYNPSGVLTIDATSSQTWSIIRPVGFQTIESAGTDLVLLEWRNIDLVFLILQPSCLVPSNYCLVSTFPSWEMSLDVSTTSCAHTWRMYFQFQYIVFWQSKFFSKHLGMQVSFLNPKQFDKRLLNFWN